MKILRSANWSRKNINFISRPGYYIQACSFRRATITHSDFSDCMICQSSFALAKIRMSDLSNTTFSRCCLTGLVITGCNTTGIRFIQCYGVGDILVNGKKIPIN